MKISLLLLALVAGSLAANIDEAARKLAEEEQEVQDFLDENDDDDDDDDTDAFDEDEEDEEQSSLLNSLSFLQARQGVCAGKAKGSCNKKGGECVTAPFADNCKALHGDVGKLKKNACKSKECQCCMPPPSCAGKIKKSCSKNGGSCIIKPFKSNCKGGTLDKKACKGKHCQCCIPGPSTGVKDTTPNPQPPTTIQPKVTVPAQETTTTTQPPPPPPTTTLPPPPPPTTTLPPPPPPTTTIPPPPPPTTTLPPPPPPTTTLPPPLPPTTTPPPPPTTTPPPPPTTTPPPPPTTTPPPPPTTTPPPPPTTTPPPPTTTPPPPPTTAIPLPPPTSAGRGCYGGVVVGGQCLSMSTDSLSWDDARAKCASKGSALASIDDPKDLQDYLNTHYRGVQFWLGGTDSASEGNWVWINGQSFNNFPWGGGQPDNYNGNQNCLTSGWSSGLYDDSGCSNSKRFICDLDFGCSTGIIVDGQCLSISTEELSWDDARAKCESQGSSLASIDDPQALQNYLNIHHKGVRFWLGGTDSASEGNWAWVNGRPFGDDFPWGANEPNNYAGNQHCLVAGHGSSGVYDDGTCSSKHRFVCNLGCTSGVLLNGQCLTVSKESLSWNEAKERCSTNNGVLASLNNPREFHDRVVMEYSDERFWLGGTDSASEGNWVWLNGQPFGGNFPWPSNEPNNWGGNQHCLQARYHGNYDDGTCSDAKRFVCNQGCTYGKTLVKGQCLTFITEELSWNDAKAKCESQNGALASLNDPQGFQDFVNANHHGVVYWIGGTDSASEGNWAWLDGRPFSNFPWGANEPNNWGGNQHCVVAGHGGSGVYDDRDCSNRVRFVCTVDNN